MMDKERRVEGLESAVERWVEEAAAPVTLAAHTPGKVVESPKGGSSL